MKKILIPIDFADSSARAIRYAEVLFCKQEVELHLIHVALASQNESQITKTFSEFESKNLKSSRIPYSFSVKRSSVLEEIQRAIHSIQPALVIIGLEEGSLSKAFLKLTDCPVLLIPRTCPEINIKKIAYANDFMNIKDSSAFRLLMDLCRTLDAEIHIIHVTKDHYLPEDKAEAAIEYYLNTVKHEYFSVDSDDIVGGIQNYVTNMKIDLLTLLLRDHGSNDLHSKGELVEQLISKSNVPVLSLV